MPFTNQTEEKQIERAVLVGLSCPSFNTDQDADERTSCARWRRLPVRRPLR